MSDWASNVREELQKTTPKKFILEEGEITGEQSDTTSDNQDGEDFTF